MINWLYISNAIIQYAQNHEKEIITREGTPTLEKILNYYKETFRGNTKAKFLSEYLIAYYKERCEVFKKDFDNGDHVSMHDIRDDGDYVFNYGNVTHLF